MSTNAIAPFSVSTIRSQLAQDIMSYYRAVLTRFEYAEWGVKVSDSRIPARVFKQALVRPDWDPDNYPVLADSTESPRERSGESSQSRRPEHRMEIAAWEREISRVRDKGAVIRGGPGSGKSFLAKTTILDEAAEALKDVNEQRISLDDAPLPIHIDLEELTKIDGTLPNAVLGYLSEDLKRKVPKFQFSAPLKDWFRERLFSQDSLWVLDAIDQVGGGDPADRLRNWLGELKTHQCRVVVTCRSADFNPSLLPAERYTLYDLAPFDWREIRQFVERWYGTKNEKARWLLEVLEGNLSLQDACGSPLILKLACSVNRDQKLPVDTTRVDLYERMLEKLLLESGLKVEALQGWIERSAALAWDVFKMKPESNQFGRDDVVAVLPSEAKRNAADRLLRRLTGCRIVERTGREYRFAHRTVLEFLAAKHLAASARRDNTGWQKATVEFPEARGRIALSSLIDRKSWLPSWSQTIVFLAGCLGHSAAWLIDVLWSGRVDLGWHRRSLALQCIAELREGDRDRQQTDSITDQAYRFLGEYRPYNPATIVDNYRGCWTALAVINGRIGGKPFIEFSIENAQNGERCRVLGVVPPGFVRNQRVMPTLLRLINCSAKGRGIFIGGAHDALGALVDMGESAARYPGVIPALLAKIVSPDDMFLRVEALFALETMGESAAKAPDVIPTLLELFESSESDQFIRNHVASTLGVLGKWPGDIEKLTSTLLGMIVSPKTDFGIRQPAAYALGEMGEAAAKANGVIPTLVSLIASSETDPIVLYGALLSLRRMRYDQRRTDLIAALNSVVFSPRFEKTIRIEAIKVLGEMGALSPGADELITSLLPFIVGTNTTDAVRDTALEFVAALCEWASPANDTLVAALIQMSLSPEMTDETRSIALSALENIGGNLQNPEDLIPVFARLIVSADASERVHISAARALGAVANHLTKEDEQLISNLIQAVVSKHIDWQIRLEAVKILGKLNGVAAAIPGVVAALIGLTDANNQDVIGDAARIALKEIFHLGIRVFADAPEIVTTRNLARLEPDC